MLLGSDRRIETVKTPATETLGSLLATFKAPQGEGCLGHLFPAFFLRRIIACLKRLDLSVGLWAGRIPYSWSLASRHGPRLILRGRRCCGPQSV